MSDPLEPHPHSAPDPEPERETDAQTELAQLHSELEQARARLAESETAFQRLERRQQIDSALAQQGALDLEAGRLLTEAAIDQMEEPDLRIAVADLQRTRPWLFRQAHALADARAPEPDLPPQDPAANAALRAAETGDRRDLLAYLRLKRRA
ncbi:MAG: hypothetical protein AAGA57_04015 [Planctomycetota bacterium]